MRILVTGGLGIIGRSLTKTLAERGHEVYALDVAHAPNEVGFTLRTDVEGANYARCDVGEYRQLERVFEEFGPIDLVYHTAAEFGRWNGEDFYEGLWKTNAVGTKNVVRLQERLGFKLVHFSSSEVYGDWPDLMVESVMDEYEIKQMNDYAMTKWVNEMQIRNSIAASGTETVVVRIFNTYGPGEYYSPYRSVNCRFLFCALKGIPWVVFKGHGRTSTYLSDAVNGLANIPENFKSGETYNISGGFYHTIEELSDTILEISGADPGLVTYKESELLTTGHKRVDNTKAVADLGLESSVTLEEGLRRTYEWMQAEYARDWLDAV